ncbi:hypothetical protein EPUS_05451 [Endocarpon pusillum Z07020]|uniref:Uncharacterized protein n=1 Tax=Endocarpon pusillum (strain Z07020 / HMAS-L-300199) TaxID=1263415 RepID=U1FYB1_ENDPU|nr:uncharacterized protein EPUS_05451 [Endocarpon pusillum Z07020]ERF69907.1 hypothetical protein EPUS_05451 [Endocarpon pusillum Z07020]
MCQQFLCAHCHYTAFDRCTFARRLNNRQMHPATCPSFEQELHERRLCSTCKAVDEATFRLYTWIETQGGDRLPTEGGEAEEGSSPLRPGGQHTEQEQQQQRQSSTTQLPATASSQSGTQSAMKDNPAEIEPEATNLDYLDLNKVRPLSDSTIASSSTLPTTIGSSAVPSKRHSCGRPQDQPPSLVKPDINAPFQPVKARRMSNPSGAYNTVPPGFIPAPLSNENAPILQANTTLVEGQPAQRNLNFRPPIISSTTDGPTEADDSNQASLNIGALKRTISTLTFDDLTPRTRTAFPASEATEVPPAYARPRSEVGLPPLLPGQTGDSSEMEEDAVGHEGAEGQADSSREASDRGSNRSGERPLSSQEYLSRARLELMGDRP